jgi:hypothetical protein
LFKIKAHNKTMLLKAKCWAKTRPSFAFSKLRRYVQNQSGDVIN